jgi:hypothetical protein
MLVASVMLSIGRQFDLGLTGFLNIVLFPLKSPSKKGCLHSGAVAQHHTGWQHCAVCHCALIHFDTYPFIIF